MSRLALLFLAMIVAGCSTSGKDLPMVRKSDPVWDMTQDHLEPGTLK